jgi:hypothetical protein
MSEKTRSIVYLLLEVTLPKVNISRERVCMIALFSLINYHWRFLSKPYSPSERGLTLTKTLIEFAMAPVED